MKGIGRIILLLFLLLTVRHSRAQLAVQQLGPDYFVAGPSEEFRYFVARQQCVNWCWAACVQMVLNYHGLYVNQQQVVQKVYGDQTCLPGDSRQIMAALSGWAPDVRGRYSQIYAQHGVWNGTDIVFQLSHRWPIIVGLQNPSGGGHAYVLTGVYYSLDDAGNPLISKVTLYNPWPGSPGKEEMFWNDFLQREPDFFKVWVVRR